VELCRAVRSSGSSGLALEELAFGNRVGMESRSFSSARAESPGFVGGGRELGQLHDGVGEGSDDFTRPGIAQALGRLDDVFGSAPKAHDDLQIRKLCAQFRAEIARVDDRGGRDDGDANKIPVSFIDQFDQFPGY
jgi:hypothetical protein